MKIERTKNAIRNMSWGFAYRLANMIMPFIFRTVMIYSLGAEYLGINSLFTSILQVLNLSELGFGTAIVYNMYKPIAENDTESICALLKYYREIYFLIGCFVLSIGIVIMPAIPYLIFGEYPYDINIYFVYFMFLLNTFISYFLFAYRSSLLSAFQRNDIESKILLYITIIKYTLEILGIYLTHQYYLFLFIELFSTIFLNLLKLFYTEKLFPEYKCRGSISISQKRDIKNNVIALLCHKIGGVILNSGDNIVISAFMGIVMVSDYGNYYYIMNAIESIILICFTGITAGIGNSFVIETVEKNRGYFKKVLFFNAWIVGWSSTALFCLYQDFIKLWVGKQYMLPDYIIVLIVVYFFCHSIRRTILVFRDGAGMWQENKWQPIISSIFNIIINIILVHYVGLAGIIISSIMSIILIDIPWETNKFCKRIEMESVEYIGLLCYYFVITGIAVGVTYLITILFHFNPLVNLLAKGIICLIVPNLIFLIIFHKNNEFLYFKNMVVRFLNIKR